MGKSLTALQQIAHWLRCPVCASSVALQPPVLCCRNGHSFDIARQGYVNLLNGPTPKNSDTAEMIAARARFLANGSYKPIAEQVSRRLGTATRILEVGAGTGYYLAHCLNTRSNAFGLATDVSTAAARRAAQTHEQMAAVVADTWLGLPLRSNSVDAVICIFAPRNSIEFFRILCPGGILVVVTPSPTHLSMLRHTYNLLDIKPDKLNELNRSLHNFEAIATQQIRYQLKLSDTQISDLIMMGPNAFHNKSLKTSEQIIEVAVYLSIFRKAKPIDPM